MIENLMLTVAEVSISSSVVIVLLMIASPYIKRNFSAKWRYMVWFMLTIRLIIPFNISLPTPPVTLVMPDSATVPSAGNTSVFNIPLKTDMQQTQNIISNTFALDFSLLKILTFIWLFGATVFIAGQLIAYLSFKRKLQNERRFIKSDAILSVFDSLCFELNIKKKPQIWCCGNICSPLMFGFIRPALFLPYESYDTCSLRVILRHELIHFKRRDLIYKLILLFANAIHWFNPLIYFMAKTAGDDIEMSCDEEVLSNSDIYFRKCYSKAILHSMYNGKLQNIALSNYFKGGKKIMKERFNNILDTTKKRNGYFALCIVTIFILAGSVFVGCQRDDANEKTPDNALAANASDSAIAANASGGGIATDASGDGVASTASGGDTASNKSVDNAVLKASNGSIAMDGITTGQSDNILTYRTVDTTSDSSVAYRTPDILIMQSSDNRFSVDVSPDNNIDNSVYLVEITGDEQGTYLNEVNKESVTDTPTLKPTHEKK